MHIGEDAQPGLAVNVQAGGVGLALVFLAGPGTAAFAQDQPGWLKPHPLEGPCAGDCATAIYGGRYVENSLGQVLVTSPETPFTWDYEGDYIVGHRGLAPRRHASGTTWTSSRRSASASASAGRTRPRVWGALLLSLSRLSLGSLRREHDRGLDRAQLRDRCLRTRSRTARSDDEGSRWMHFFAPEITFALPRAPRVRAPVPHPPPFRRLRAGQRRLGRGAVRHGRPARPVLKACRGGLAPV